jgi:hypothetical protein
LDIFIRVKAAGKRRDMLEQQPAVVPENTSSAAELITHLVTENVRFYNAKVVDQPFFQYLSEQQLEDGVHTGKVGFGSRSNENQQDEAQAVRNALQCFEDGIYRVLINENEITPNSGFSLKEGDIVTFIRLVMLAGRKF